MENIKEEYILIKKSYLEEIVKDSKIGMDTNQDNESEYESYSSLNWLASRLLKIGIPKI